MNARTMPLSQKGRQSKRPTLPNRFAEQVAQALEQQQGVNARTHWQLGNEQVVDGADFYLGDEEYGHLHLDGEAHVPLTVPLRNALVTSGRAHPFPWGQAWVVWPVRSSADVKHALWLFDLRRRLVAGEAPTVSASAARPGTP
jgi:hypothetical protein